MRKRSDRHPGATLLPEHRVVKMQHTIGNRAVQRMLQREMQPDKTAVVQRAPDDKKEASRPLAFATLVLSGKGKLPGENRIAGHEGKTEVWSLSFDQSSEPTASKTDDKHAYERISVVKPVDKSSQSLMEATDKGEQITSAMFEMMKYDTDGKAAVRQTIEYSDGIIISHQMLGAGDIDGRPIDVMGIQFPTKPKK